MKNWFKKKGNILTLIILAFVLWKQVPILITNFKMSGETIHSKEYEIIGSQETLTFPPIKGRAMAIFWATWCGPCKLEMERLKESVSDGKIPKDLIFAINPFESAETSKEFIRKNQFPFQFIDASEVANRINIMATPTTLLIEDQKIISLSSGLSIVGIWRAESFL